MDIYQRIGYTYVVRNYTHWKEKAMTETKKRGNPNWGYVKPYHEAREEISKMGFKTMSEYKQWVAEEQPEGFSNDPYQIYRYRGEWVSTAHYLGKKDYIIPEINQEYVSESFFSNLKDTLKNMLHIRFRKHSILN